MAAVTKSTRGVSLASTVPPSNNKVNGLLAGEAIAAGDACHIAASGRVMRSIGGDPVDGFALSDAGNQEPITLFHGVVANYGDGLTPGTALYLSTTTAGGLDTTANGSVIAVAYDTQRVALGRSRPVS